MPFKEATSVHLVGVAVNGKSLVWFLVQAAWVYTENGTNGNRHEPCSKATRGPCSGNSLYNVVLKHRPYFDKWLHTVISLSHRLPDILWIIYGPILASWQDLRHPDLPHIENRWSQARIDLYSIPPGRKTLPLYSFEIIVTFQDLIYISRPFEWPQRHYYWNSHSKMLICNH